MKLAKMLRNIDLALSASILAPMVGMIVLQIVLRSVFSIPLMGSEELAPCFLICVLFLGLPVVSSGVNPVHLGIVAIFNLMIGLMTPPMGLSPFLISDVAKTPINSILRGLWPYLFTLLAAPALLTYIPELSLWIPDMVGR